MYSPPEWVEHGEMSLRSGSVWSMGVLLYNMTCGDVPYHTDDAIITNVLPPCEHLSHGGWMSGDGGEWVNDGGGECVNGRGG